MIPTLVGVRHAAVILALASCLCLGLLTGCGSSETQPAPPELFTADQVSVQFKRETGRSLLRAQTDDVAWDQLGYGLNPSQELLDAYGIFSVYVAKQGHLGALDSLLHDKATKKALEKDPEGVYWELDSNSGTWIAYKRYPPNVVLAWFSGSKTQAADTRFERLDRVLAGLPG
jgi:hypothetical protein